ncbi:hypothetical protein OGAPHI_002222 [Ogataea philodendri]|uniref:Uncharacterized protein n=1 Tax=Ogataea philodendri TaxID=1378263 RepID=A0A9P8PA32_9ASCO|nr:uncharacterized protein OGAPHI_002222 [Ogataea philodendri]KAH3668468.1 hypothetical protein OGAPHI_002222 [Ogataea philodendri]
MDSENMRILLFRLLPFQLDVLVVFQIESLFKTSLDIRSNSSNPRRSNKADSICVGVSDSNIDLTFSIKWSLLSGLILWHSVRISSNRLLWSDSAESSLDSSSSSISTVFSNCLSKSVTCLETSNLASPSPKFGKEIADSSPSSSNRLRASIIGCIACIYDDVDETL